MNKKQILSVAAGMLLLSACSEYDAGLTTVGAGDYTPSELQLMEKYTENFEARYGKIDENHTWGFGSAAQGAKTRGAEPNTAVWENVPPVITPEQKDIVRQYFQQNPNLGYENPNWTDFWVQQVYKGGNGDSKTTEKYGDKPCSDRMEELVAGKDDHINDFNKGDFNLGNEDRNKDERMLMLDSSTDCFGYRNSGESTYHYDKTALVHWTVIRDWANANGLNGELLNDGWNRSYMGFDWDLKSVVEELYAGKEVGVWHEGYWDDENKVYVQGWTDYDSYPVLEFKGEEYRYLKSEVSNQTACDVVDLQGEITDAVIEDMLSRGYLPVAGGANRKWAKIGSAADGYYSDWIVSLTEAKKSNTPDTPEEPQPTWYRIMCEDLGNTNDFDFNDLVFDVYFTGEPGNYTAHVRVQAAGGTLPIYLAYDGNEAYEAHHLLGGDETIVPINVGTGNTAAPKDIEIWMATNNPNDINIYVEKQVAENTKTTILLPKSGNSLNPAPQKICIENGQNVRWMKEMQQIEWAYPHFDEWVQSESYGLKWTTTDVNEGYLY